MGYADSNYTLIVQASIFDSLGAFVTVSSQISVYPTSGLVDTSSSSLMSSTLALSSSTEDSEELLQQVNNVAETANVASSTVAVVVIDTRNNCTNNCSNHGVCLIETCTCDKGWELYDCSITTAELQARTLLRSTLLDAVIAVFNATNTESITIEDIKMNTVFLNSITDAPDELAQDTVSKAAGFLNNLITTSKQVVKTDALDLEAIQLFGRTVSNVAISAFSTQKNTTTQESLYPTVTSSVFTTCFEWRSLDGQA